MHSKSLPSFAFLVMCFNHENYILEHLESIKYLVVTHGKGIDVDLIINDDCSIDNTCGVINQWLAFNGSLFRSVQTIFNPKNFGTCASLKNMLMHMKSERFKLTAGDDVYSFENIFDLINYESDEAIISGRPLYLFGKSLAADRLSLWLATATQVIYEEDQMLHRFKHFSYNNAPNIAYRADCVKNKKVTNYLGQFDVIEDWPLQLAIARQFPECRFKLIDRVLVYYRRTAGSTYIVASQRFIEDKIKVYDDLIFHEASQIERVRLLVRRFCFKSQDYWISKLINLDLYFFMASFIYHIGRITKWQRGLNINLEKHRQHYSHIRVAATQARRSFK